MQADPVKAGATAWLSLAMLGCSFASPLSDFETSVAKPDDPPTSHHQRRPHDRATDDGDPSFLGAWIFTRAYHGCRWLVYDWWAHPESDPAGYGDSAGVDGFRHEIGSQGLPYARFDYRWQYLDSDTDAHDFLVEAGYRMFAFYGRTTQYEDHAADESLDIDQYYGLLRYGGSDDFLFSGSFQIGAGLGGYVIDGPSRRQSGPALTIPVMFYPTEWVGFEFRPAWASINEKTISDYDVSASAGHRFFHVRLGYRWLWVQHEGHWLDGPYAGVSLSF